MHAPRRSTAITLGVTSAVALLLSGCASNTDYQGVCIDKDTQTRLDDESCDDSDPGYVGGSHGWFFLARGTSAPAVGDTVASGSGIPPVGTSSVRGGVSADGGTVSGSTTRGGFGFHSSGHVGG
ncbi:hypothetical protein [Cellulomonas sp. P5_C5]